ncbi:MAG: Leu/Ile/Val-binding protein [Anaerolineales bacterium]|nr:Leu/Ile/Val-binding protein [Anaerolineales bacterium]
MKNLFAALIIISLFVTACASTDMSGSCNDPLGCVTVGSDEPLTIAAALTLSGPNAPYGVDALRGVELAIADRGTILNHPIELVQEDELCTPEGGQAAAERLAQNPNVLGVIGATCSGATEKAAAVLSEAGMVLISPSSTAAILTSEEAHQDGFFRTIHNDLSQASMVAEFAFEALDARSMATIHDGSAYSNGLQEQACVLFTQRGGGCVAQKQIISGKSARSIMEEIAALAPEVLYIPVYTEDAMNILKELPITGLGNTAIIGSDGLLNTDIATKARNADGIYLSGPATIELDASFQQKYEERYNEKPVAVFAAQAYDAAMILFNAIERSFKTTGRDIIIGRKAVRAALYATAEYPGLSGTLTCSLLGDCAPPNIVIYQLVAGQFEVLYP